MILVTPTGVLEGHFQRVIELAWSPHKATSPDLKELDLVDLDLGLDLYFGSLMELYLI